MIIGVPKETGRHENRVGLNRLAVQSLAEAGHKVLVEKGCGTMSKFAEEDYQKAGASIVYRANEIYERSDIVCKVSRPSKEEAEMVKEGQIICAFHHLAVAPHALVTRLVEKKATLIGYEIVEDADGDRSVLIPFSEMAGQMAVHEAAHYLQVEEGGRGILLGSAPAIPPSTVVIIGAGTAGTAAARQAKSAGAHVIVLGQDIGKLRHLYHDLGVVTVIATSKDRIAQYVRIADVLIGAVLVPGAKSPILVTEDMVKSMKPGSVIVDLSIDQGGTVETSRPTTPDDPVFIRHGVVHYCVPNMTSRIPRTASRALGNAVTPFILEICEKGARTALLENAGLRKGVYMYRGVMTNKAVAEVQGIEARPVEEVLSEAQ
jgi:alanine dehydrogenase